jgi:hypothetical protein
VVAAAVVAVISIQAIADALAGRRIAVGADQDDARRELKACAAQLAAAQAQIARLGAEKAATDRRATAAIERAELAENALKLEAREVARLERQVASPGGFGRTLDPPPGLGTTLAPAADRDRRNLARLEARVRELEDENTDLRRNYEALMKLAAG